MEKKVSCSRADSGRCITNSPFCNAGSPKTVQTYNCAQSDFAATMHVVEDKPCTWACYVPGWAGALCWKMPSKLI